MLARAFAALTLLSLCAPSVRAETEADVPRDPDFYFAYDFDKHDWSPVPRPDLSKRPRPRDSRTLSGAFAPDPQGTLRMFTEGGGPATSTCIGSPVSTLCAVETFLYGSILPLLLKGGTIIYRVHGVMKLGTEDLGGSAARPLPAWYPSRPSKIDAWREGDVHVQILYMNCYRPSSKRCSSALIPVTVTVREVAVGDWEVIDTYVPRY